ncbi:MAG: tetratricopeptide repeat protein [Planctomycetes bacterium]|jgi:tetratricopeptide (TPR) repeat protein|nr:tetratricopeptide repeat protein [Planctomycetota bacterium]
MLRAILVFSLMFAGPVLAQELTPEQAREAEALMAKGVGLFDRQDYPEAIRVFLEAREMNPFDVRAPFYLAQCEVNLWMGDQDEARAPRIEEYLEEARRIDEQFGGTYYLIGVFALQLRDYRRALDGFLAALERGFQVRTARGNVAWCLFLWGVSLAGDRNTPIDLPIRVFDDARTRLEALKDDLRYSQAEREQFRGLWMSSMVNLVAMHQKAGNAPRALEILGILMKLEPDNPLHHYNLGLLQGSQQKSEEALAAYERALELNRDPEWVEPHLRIACIHSLDGKFDRAEHHFDLFFAKHPDHVEGCFRLAEHYVRKDDPERVEATYRRCLELDPLDLRKMYGLGRALIRLGQDEEAEMWLGLYAALEALQKEYEVAEAARTGRIPEFGTHVPSEFGPTKPYQPVETPK